MPLILCKEIPGLPSLTAANVKLSHELAWWALAPLGVCIMFGVAAYCIRKRRLALWLTGAAAAPSQPSGCKTAR